MGICLALILTMYVSVTHNHPVCVYVCLSKVKDLTSVFLCFCECRQPVPGEWETNLSSFQKLLILRCLRADCLTQGLQDFVSAQLGQRFIEPQVSLKPRE